MNNSIKRKITKFVKKSTALMPLMPKKYYCSVCGNRSVYFLDWGTESEIFHNLKIVGGGYRKSVRCPVCNSIDRTRWLNYVLENKTDIYENAQNVILHIAPENCIEEKIRSILKGKNSYITGDIKKGLADEVVDITNIKYEDNYFDYIIVNHVLEHVENEKKAMQEFFRVLKNSGKLIFSMPICAEKNTFEVQGGISEERRLELYGQKDHVRLYGKDTKEHIEKYDFRVVEYKVDDYVTDEEVERKRYIKGDRIYVAEKNYKKNKKYALENINYDS